MDEPHPTQFANMSKMMSDIQHVDRKHICYANIFPTGGPEHYATLGVKDYNEYIDRYMAEVPEITVLSFDKYPIIKDPNVADSPRQILGEWYQCLEIVRDRRSVREWISGASCSLFPTPATRSRRWTTCVCKLTATSPTARRCSMLHLLDPDGRESRTLEIPQRADRRGRYPHRDLRHREIGARRDPETVVGLPGQQSNGRLPHRHPLPLDTRALDKLPAEITELSVGRETNTACISFFENHGYHFMMAVNTDINEKCYLNVGTQEHVRRIRKDGSVQPASNDQRTLTLDPSDMVLYMW